MQPNDATSLFSALANALETSWRSVARAEQIEPPGEWDIWLLLAGRGFGKTRTGAEWVLEQVATGKRRVALVAPTSADCRDVIVEGDSGILACSPSWNMPVYEPSKRRVTWPNGAIATLFSAEEPERLRGPQHDAAWCDELAAWQFLETWDMLQFGLRLGDRPRIVVTTTPKPTKLIKDLIAREGRDVVVTRGRTSDNAANLAPSFIRAIEAQYAGTRLGRQELDGELLTDTPGALWTRDMIEAARVRLVDVPELTRILVAVDPAVSSGEDSDETGIIVAGLGADGKGYVLEDRSGRMSPTEWARVAVEAYRRRRADRIVAEKNQGGDMVESTVRVVDPGVSFKAVHASRGKYTRAEPVSALYEQSRVRHVGAFPRLEDQMCEFAPGELARGDSPDRMDALVWALTELMLGGGDSTAIIEFYRREVAKDQAKKIEADRNRRPSQLGGGETLTMVRLLAPPGISNAYGMSGQQYLIGEDRILSVFQEDAGAFVASGFTRVLETIDG